MIMIKTRIHEAKAKEIGSFEWSVGCHQAKKPNGLAPARLGNPVKDAHHNTDDHLCT